MNKNERWGVRCWVWTGDKDDPYEPEYTWFNGHQADAAAREYFEYVTISNDLPQASLVYDDGEQI